MAKQRTFLLIFNQINCGGRKFIKKTHVRKYSKEVQLNELLNIATYTQTSIKDFSEKTCVRSDCIKNILLFKYS